MLFASSGFLFQPQLRSSMTESAKGQKSITSSSAAWSRGPLRGEKSQEHPHPHPGSHCNCGKLAPLSSSMKWGCYLPTSQDSTNKDSSRVYNIKKLNSKISETQQVSLISDIWSLQPTEAIAAAAFSLTSKRNCSASNHGESAVKEMGSLALLCAWAAPTKPMGPKK